MKFINISMSRMNFKEWLLQRNSVCAWIDESGNRIPLHDDYKKSLEYFFNYLNIGNKTEDEINEFAQSKNLIQVFYSHGHVDFLLFGNTLTDAQKTEMSKICKHVRGSCSVYMKQSGKQMHFNNIEELSKFYNINTNEWNLKNTLGAAMIGGAALGMASGITRDNGPAQPTTQAPQIKQTQPIAQIQPVNNKPIEKEEGKSKNNEIDMARTAKIIAQHEGLAKKRNPKIDEYFVYDDGVGNLTIGVGHFLKPSSQDKFKRLFGDTVNFKDVYSGKRGITKEQAYKLFEEDLKSHVEVAKRIFPKFDQYPQTIKETIVNMIFRGEISTKHKTYNFMINDQWDKASEEYLKRYDYENAVKNKIPGIMKRMEENQKKMKEYGEQLNRTLQK